MDQAGTVTPAGTAGSPGVVAVGEEVGEVGVTEVVATVYQAPPQARPW